jgi:hypothetical protein
MQNDILTSLTRLSDAELVTRVKSLAARERDATAQLVAHLAELDTRDVYLREGHGSLHVDAGGVGDAATPHGGRSGEFVSLFRNEFACGKADDGRPGRLPKEA